ncbi:MAG: tRNA1(Val) (adenine(37)-N6)-methyltransferase [Clostridiales bacterium]|jgi:tRNA1Val (adenine37-N6)-methyltransferase|nr:tRNA1(Val) (adenine(37)-N6)-methyltransferase [Clostridiales bacterium]
MKRIDDLQLKGLKIMQDTAQFCFGTDAVLLSDFVADCRSINRDTRIIDLGCGNGIIPILLAGKTDSRRITGVEIQKQAADLALENVILNGLTERICVVNADFRMQSAVQNGVWDIVVCNPPYKENGGGIKNPESGLAIARHEIMCNLDSIFETAKRLLKFRGKLCMIHRPERLAEIFMKMHKHGLEPKRMRMVHFSVDKPPIMVLIEAVGSGGVKLFCEPPIVIKEV